MGIGLPIFGRKGFANTPFIGILGVSLSDMPVSPNNVH